MRTTVEQPWPDRSLGRGLRRAVAAIVPHPPRTRVSSAQPCSTLPGRSTNPRFSGPQTGPSIDSTQNHRPPLFAPLPSAPFAARGRGLRHVVSVHVQHPARARVSSTAPVAPCRTARPTPGVSARRSILCKNHRPPLFAPLPSALLAHGRSVWDDFPTRVLHPPRMRALSAPPCALCQISPGHTKNITTPQDSSILSTTMHHMPTPPSSRLTPHSSHTHPSAPPPPPLRPHAALPTNLYPPPNPHTTCPPPPPHSGTASANRHHHRHRQCSPLPPSTHPNPPRTSAPMLSTTHTKPCCNQH